MAVRVGRLVSRRVDHGQLRHHLDGFVADAAAGGRVQANPAAKARGSTELPGSRDQGWLQQAQRCSPPLRLPVGSPPAVIAAVDAATVPRRELLPAVQTQPVSPGLRTLLVTTSHSFSLLPQQRGGHSRPGPPRDTALHVDDDALLLGGFKDTHQVHAASRLAIWLAGTYAVSAHPPSAGGGRSATASATATINSAV